MSLFNIKNPSHQQILKEELQRVKKILVEGAAYSTDEIWSLMTPAEKELAIASSNKYDGPDLADQYAGSDWDAIPADVQDMMDLSDFELSKYDQSGRTNLRAIEYFKQQNPEVVKVITKFLAAVGRGRINDLTIKQTYKLLMAVQQFVNSKNPVSPTVDDTAGKRAFMSREREAGRSSGLD